MGLSVPAELVLGQVVLRRPDPQQASAVVEAVNQSLDHLRPWMVWAQQPAELEPTALRLALAAAAFDVGGDATWTMFDVGSDAVIGACGLHDRLGAGARDLGYWVRAGWTGKGVASVAAAALTAVGFEVLDLERVEVRCDEFNELSAAVPRRLGFQCVSTVDASRVAPSDSGRTMIWAMRREAWVRR